MHRKLIYINMDVYECYELLKTVRVFWPTMYFNVSVTSSDLKRLVSFSRFNVPCLTLMCISTFWALPATTILHSRKRALLFWRCLSPAATYTLFHKTWSWMTSWRAGKRAWGVWPVYDLIRCWLDLQRLPCAFICDAHRWTQLASSVDRPARFIAAVVSTRSVDTRW